MRVRAACCVGARNPGWVLKHFGLEDNQKEDDLVSSEGLGTFVSEAFGFPFLYLGGLKCGRKHLQ